MIYFDTRPDAAPDGQWTRFIDQRRMEREHWRKASSAHMRGPICIVDHYGAERLIPEGRENEMREAIGMMLKSVLLRARDEKLFLPLPFAPTCTLGVEDFDGAFAWPIYEERDGNALVMQPPRQGS